MPQRWRPSSHSKPSDKKGNARDPTIVPLWPRDWEHLSTCFAYPAAIRTIIYTTNALESVNRSVRKVVKTRGAFPTDEAALKQMFLALRNAQAK